MLTVNNRRHFGSDVCTALSNVNNITHDILLYDSPQSSRILLLQPISALICLPIWLAVDLSHNIPVTALCVVSSLTSRRPLHAIKLNSIGYREMRDASLQLNVR